MSGVEVDESYPRGLFWKNLVLLSREAANCYSFSK